MTLKSLAAQFERGGAEHVLQTYLKLHEGKIGSHWLWVAIEQIVHGTPEAEVMADYGYAREQRWLPIETAPKDGFMLVHEDDAIRALLRIDGKWHKPGYPGIVSQPYGDVLVGEDAQRVLPKGWRLELRDGCCETLRTGCPFRLRPALESGMSDIVQYVEVTVTCRSTKGKPFKRRFIVQEPKPAEWTASCDEAMRVAQAHAQQNCGFAPKGGRWLPFEATSARLIKLPFEVTENVGA